MSTDLLQQLAGEVTGYEPEAIRARDSWQGDLGLDRLKRERLAARLVSLLGLPEGTRERFLGAVTVEDWRGIAGLPEPSPAVVEGPGTLLPPASQGEPSAPRTEEAVTETLLRIAAEKTGYDRSLLDLDADLEADLGIDSIKQAQIAGRLRLVYPLAWDPGMRIRDFPTLRHWVRWVVSGGARPGTPRAVRAERRVPSLRERALAPGSDFQELAGSRVWLTEDSFGIARALAARLEKVGASVSWPLREDASCGESPAALVHLSPLSAPSAASDDGLRAALECLRLARAAGSSSLRTCVFATAMGGDFALSDATRALATETGGSVGGFAKAWAAERRELRLRIVDFDPVELARAEAAAAAAGALLEELAAPPEPDGEPGPRTPEVGYRDGRRFALRWERAAIDFRAEPPRSRSRAFPAIAIAGGARGIGAEVALELARRDHARLALLGRTPPEDLPVESVARLREMREAGAEVEYLRCDVTDAAEVERVLGPWIRARGGLDGLVHAAGVIEDRRLELKDEESFRRVYSAKVQGMRSLEEVGRRAQPAFFAVFGSVSGRFGNEGQCDYAAANEAVTQRMARFRAANPAVHAFSVGWGAWEGTGMAARSGLAELLKASGQGLLTLTEGVRAFRAEALFGAAAAVVVQSEPAPSVAVASPGASPELEALVLAHDPGARHEEVIRLEPAAQPWLADHVIGGRALLPASVAIALLIRAGRKTLPGFRCSSIRGFRISRPVAVVPEGNALVRVTACAAPGLASGERSVWLALGDENGPCFECELIVASPDAAPARGAVRSAVGSGEGGRRRARAELYPAAIPLGGAFEVLDAFTGLERGGFGDLRASALEALAPRGELAVFEAAFQCASLLETEAGRGALLPRSFEEARFYSGQPERVLAEPGSGDRYDMKMIDGRGELVAEILGYRGIDPLQLGVLR